MISNIRPSTPNAAVPSASAAPAASSVTPSPAVDRAEIGASATAERRVEAGAKKGPSALEAMRAEVAAESASLEAKLPPHREGEVIVKVKPGTSTKAFTSLTRDLGLKVIEKFDIPENMREAMGGEMYLLKASSLRTSECMALLSKNPVIIYAVSNDELHLVDPVETTPAQAPPTVLTADPVVPNDLDSRLWGLQNTGQQGGTAGADVHATEAWAVETGRRDGPIVAVVDTGVDYTHPELAANIWTNPDPNAPDQHGYNFYANTPDPMDDHNHGTHCSGTIAAEGNNGQGVVGVNWNAQIMGLKFLGASGSGSTSDAVRAILYASGHDARITSNSWGGGAYNQALYDALKASPALHIFAAGNNFSDNDRNPAYPASYDLDNIIAVAASDRNDRRTNFSNWGHQTVDLAAPGKDILSTIPDNAYATYSGTSMATPHVSGAAALIASHFPDATNEQIKGRLLNSVDKHFFWEPYVVSGGRLNVVNALEEDSTSPHPTSDLATTLVSPTRAQVTWSATGDDGCQGNATGYDLRWSDVPISDDGAEGTVAFERAYVVATGTPQAPGTAEQAAFDITPSSRERNLYVAMRVRDNLGNTSPTTVTSTPIAPAYTAFEGRYASDWRPDEAWAQVEESGLGKVWTSTTTGEMGHNANVSLRTRSIDLSEMRNATLHFQSQLDLEYNYDNMFVEVSDDRGKTWNEVGKCTGKADWTPEAIDISAYDGKRVIVRFRVATDASIVSRGVKLKGVVVAGDPA